MDVELARAFLLALPHVTETMQWGENVVFWVGDKAVGGKMFCLLNLEGGKHGIVSFAAGTERFAELQESEGFFPAPYFAREQWIAARDWSVVRNAEWGELFRNAHAVVRAKLPTRVLALIEGTATPDRDTKGQTLPSPTAAKSKANKSTAKKKLTAKR